MLLSRINLTCLFLLAVSGVSADPMSQDDRVLLQKMVAATRQTDYSGTFIYQSGNYVETSRITHLFDGENEHERLEGLDGERSEIIRKNGQAWCYLGDSKVMVAKLGRVRTFPALLPEQLELLQENYIIQHGEDDRVAGFHAYSIVFQPRDKMRYAHKMWAHSASGLLLKALVQDERSRIVEQYTFTHLNLEGDIDRKWIVSKNNEFQPVTDEAVAAIQARSTPAESGWKVFALPVGFKKITEVTRRLRGKEGPVTHIVYSDGLAGISVFVEQLNDKSGTRTGLYGKGVLQVYSRILDNHLLTVVGEVPARTVMQVAVSVRYGGQQ
jgi:sigma-E factor negative regulatory protein RseB